jgi:hypothetical protein
MVCLQVVNKGFLGSMGVSRCHRLAVYESQTGEQGQVREEGAGANGEGCGGAARSDGTENDEVANVRVTQIVSQSDVIRCASPTRGRSMDTCVSGSCL